MKKTRSRGTERSRYRDYFKVAQEYLESAQDNFDKKRFIPTCGDAVHSIIAAADALTIYFLGKRSTGQSHMEAIQLLREVAPRDEDLGRQLVKFQRVLGLKEVAEYGGGRVDRNDAQSAIRDAQRFLSFVQDRVG